MTEKLLPCPFCGSTSYDYTPSDVICCQCYAHGPSADDEPKTQFDLWNTRADSAADVIRGLRDLLKARNADDFCTKTAKALTDADTWLSQHTETKEETVSG